MSNDCNCGCSKGAGVVPGPCVPTCSKPQTNLYIKTETLPNNISDEDGQPFAPKLGAYENTLVQYLYSGNIYFYDSNGIWTWLNNVTSLSDALTLLQNKEQSDVENLQININQLANKEEQDVENLQTNINQTVNKLDGKQNLLISGTNIKTINGESILGEGDIPVQGGSGSDQLTDAEVAKVQGLPDTTVINLGPVSASTTSVTMPVEGRMLSTGQNFNGTMTFGSATNEQAGVMSATDKAKIDNLPANVLNAIGPIIPGNDSVTIRYGVSELDNGGGYTTGIPIPAATATASGVMSAADKAKLNSLSASSTLVSAPTTSYTADDVNLAFGDTTVALTPAVGTTGGANSKAGIMSAFQATQLAALAQAYEAEEKGTVLYEGSASTNNIELSESGLTYDHLIIVAQYMGMGSFALEQQVSEVFYPTDSVRSFQMNATDITTGNTPTVELIQDIWSITEDGTEIELASALKASVNSETTVTPDTTSNFTITKVVGFGKKSVMQS